jgi:hypothetical protein
MVKRVLPIVAFASQDDDRVPKCLGLFDRLDIFWHWRFLSFSFSLQGILERKYMDG